MGILQLLANKNFITFNKTIAKKIGIDEAILFGSLCSFSSMYEDVEFYCEQQKLIEDTCLTEYRLRNAMKNLTNYGLILVVKKGLPAKNYYLINEDIVLQLLCEKDSDLHRTSGAKFDTTSASNFDTTSDSDFDTTIYNKNIDNKNIDKENNKLYIEQTKATTIKRFKKPTLEDVKNYCIERKNNVDAVKFINYYESNGWKVGKNSMKDWKACIRTWERNYTYNSKLKNNNSNNTIDNYFSVDKKGNTPITDNLNDRDLEDSFFE